MHYLDQFILEQNERNRLSGLVQEYNIQKHYNTVWDIPKEFIDGIIRLFHAGQFDDGKSQMDELFKQVKKISIQEAESFYRAVLKIYQDEKAKK